MNKGFSMKSRLPNILITANAMALTKVTLESAYKVLKR